MKREELTKMLRDLAERAVITDDPSACIYDYSDSNVDDAYYRGVRDGETLFARELERILETYLTAQPIAWSVTHFQDGVKRPNVSYYGLYAQAEHVFNMYGKTPGIEPGILRALYAID